MSPKDIPNEAAQGAPYFTPAQNPPSGTAVDPQPNGNDIPTLFKPLKIRGMTVHNRIFLSPLCQYSAQDGHHTAWHQTHLGGIAQRGPGAVTVEATSVTPEGRITPEDSGLWKDSQIEPLKYSVDFAHSQGVKIGIQLSHAGRKASTVSPWLSRGYVATEAVNGWPDNVLGPSNNQWNEKFPLAKELTKAQIEEFKTAFGEAVKRSLKAGFDFIEIHNAHGYLLHEFISPVVNKRTDEYGGSFENRIRLTLEIVDLVRSIVPKDYPVFLRLSATDALEQEAEESWKVEDSIRLASILVDHGVDLLDVSAAGQDERQKLPSGEAYQAPYALQIKKAVGDKLLVTSVGSIRDGKTAQSVLDQGLDAVFSGRWFQKNPGLVWQFAEDLGVTINVAHQIAWAFGGFGGARVQK